MRTKIDIDDLNYLVNDIVNDYSFLLGKGDVTDYTEFAKILLEEFGIEITS